MMSGDSFISAYVDNFALRSRPDVLFLLGMGLALFVFAVRAVPMAVGVILFNDVNAVTPVDVDRESVSIIWEFIGAVVLFPLCSMSHSAFWHTIWDDPPLKRWVPLQFSLLLSMAVVGVWLFG